jgi:hypothetical protein
LIAAFRLFAMPMPLLVSSFCAERLRTPAADLAFFHYFCIHFLATFLHRLLSFSDSFISDYADYNNSFLRHFRRHFFFTEFSRLIS